MAQPAVDSLRRALPGVRIAIAARSGLASLFGLMPEIDDTVGVSAIGEHAFDAAVLLPNSFRSALVAARAGIPERWGYRTEWRGLLLTRGVDVVEGLHQVDAYRHLVESLGFGDDLPGPGAPDRGLRAPRLVVPDATRAAGAAQLHGAGWDSQTPLVALAPGAAYGSAKCWPVSSFAELAGDLAQDGVQVVLVGGTGDVETGRKIVAALAGRDVRHTVLNLVGQNDISGLAGVLVHCRTLVSNDSGAMHLGAAVGLAVTAPFGPTDERLTRPLGEQHTVLTHQVWCRPCMLRECPIDHRCMTGISVQSVAAAARRSL